MELYGGHHILQLLMVIKVISLIIAETKYVTSNLEVKLSQSGNQDNT